MILKAKTDNFNKKFDVVSVFIEHNGEILLLHREDDKPQGNTWAMPAGKVNEKETLIDALAREVKEEISLKIKKRDCKYFEGYYVRYPKFDFIYHVYYLPVKEKPAIYLNLDEHKDYQWIKPKDALKINLIEDEDTCIKHFFKV